MSNASARPAHYNPDTPPNPKEIRNEALRKQMRLVFLYGHHRAHLTGRDRLLAADKLDQWEKEALEEARQIRQMVVEVGGECATEPSDMEVNTRTGWGPELVKQFTSLEEEVIDLLSKSPINAYGKTNERLIQAKRDRLSELTRLI